MARETHSVHYIYIYRYLFVIVSYINLFNSGIPAYHQKVCSLYWESPWFIRWQIRQTHDFQVFVYFCSGLQHLCSAYQRNGLECHVPLSSLPVFFFLFRGACWTCFFWCVWKVDSSHRYLKKTYDCLIFGESWFKETWAMFFEQLYTFQLWLDYFWCFI